MLTAPDRIRARPAKSAQFPVAQSDSRNGICGNDEEPVHNGHVLVTRHTVAVAIVKRRAERHRVSVTVSPKVALDV